MSKPGKSLKGLCKKLGVRLTVKRGKKRVYKSVKILKEQCKRKVKKKKKKVFKRRRKFGTERTTKRVVYTIGEVHGANHSHYILDELFKYLKSNNKIPYIFTEYGMILPPKEYGNLTTDYTNYLTKMFNKEFVEKNVIQINKELHNTSIKLSKGNCILVFTKNGMKIVVLDNEENFKNKRISSYKKILENKPFVSALDEINKMGYEDQFISNVKEIGDEVESYDDLNRVLGLIPNNILKEFNISEQESVYEGIDDVFKTLEKKTEGTYRKEIISDFEFYKQAFKSLMKNYEKFLEFSKSLKRNMGEDYKNFNKLQYYFYTIGPNPWVEGEMNRIKSEYIQISDIELIVSDLIDSYDEFIGFFVKCIFHTAKVRDKYLKGKIDKKNKELNDKNIPFIVYLGVHHFANYNFSGDYEEINLIGKIQSILPPDNNHLFTLTDTKYYKYRESYRNLLRDKGIALSTIKLDKAAPGLGDWVEQRRLENNGNYSYSFGKRKRKRKVKRKRKREVKRKRKREVKRKRKREVVRRRRKQK